MGGVTIVLVNTAHQEHALQPRPPHALTDRQLHSLVEPHATPPQLDQLEKLAPGQLTRANAKAEAETITVIVAR